MNTDTPGKQKEIGVVIVRVKIGLLMTSHVIVAEAGQNHLVDGNLRRFVCVRRNIIDKVFKTHGDQTG